jgi:hypothetical protein
MKKIIWTEEIQLLMLFKDEKIISYFIFSIKFTSLGSTISILKMEVKDRKKQYLEKHKYHFEYAIDETRTILIVS